MAEVWLPLLTIVALAATWHHVLRLRERATAHARRLCERHGLQLLDDSVSLHRLRAHWREGGLHVLREYRFDTSRGGDDRQPASLTLYGNRLIGAGLPSREPIAATAAAAPVATPYLRPTLPGHESGSGNVIPFDRERRTLH